MLHWQWVQGLLRVHKRGTRLRLRAAQRVRKWWMFEMSPGECWGLNEKRGGGTGSQKKLLLNKREETREESYILGKTKTQYHWGKIQARIRLERWVGGRSRTTAQYFFSPNFFIFN